MNANQERSTPGTGRGRWSALVPRSSWLLLPQPEHGRRVLRLRFGAQLALFVLLGLAVLGSSGWLLLRGVGGILHLGRLSTSDQLNIVKIALSVVAGVGGVIALTVAYRRQQLGEAADARAEAAHRREDTKAFTERFESCVTQLGTDRPAVQLGGVHALVHLADDWAEGRQTCIDMLCAYLRMPYSPDQPNDPVAHAAFLAWREVRHTIWRLIGNHLRPNTTSVSWCGHDFDFTGAVIDGADLHGAQFSGGTVHYGGARFTGGIVNFIGASFSGGTVNFRGASFSGGSVRFAGARFTGATVHFSDAQFSGGTVHFGRASFSGGTVNFQDASFSGRSVRFGGARFSGGTVNFSAEFSGSTVDFIGARFSGAVVHFRGARFTGGQVDLSEPRDYSVPPVFDSWPSPPAGLLLPDPK